MTEQNDPTPHYGAPVKADLIKAESFDNGTGIEYDVIIFPDSHPEKIKKKRSPPEVLQQDFFSSLVNIDNRYFFSGILNGWLGLTLLELMSLSTPAKKLVWVSGKSKEAPSFIDKGNRLIAKLRAPDWSDNGYSKSSPGYVWWADASKDGTVRVLYHGTDMIKIAQQHEHKDALAVRVHMFGHRYAKKKESLKDTISYHTGVLIEWDHHEFCSLVELTWLNGMGGYRGNSNWVVDSYGKEESSLYKAMPPYMKIPWNEKRSELRFYDLPFKNLEEFKGHLKKYTGKHLRFIDPKIKRSSDVRLENATREQIIIACLNYIRRDPSYSEYQIGFSKLDAGNNCQTFAANIFGYLVDKKTKPFTGLFAPLFKPRHSLFRQGSKGSWFAIEA